MPFIKTEYQPSVINVENNFYDLSKRNLRQVSGLNAIREAIENILLTFQGEVLFFPEFGCGILGNVFDNFGKTNEALIRNKIINSLKRWETRIVLDEENVQINIDEDNNSIELSIPYIEKSTGKSDTYRKVIGV